MPPSPLRIAILECDSAPARAHIKHGGYGGLFTRLLNAGAAALAEERSDAEEVRLKISVFDVENEMERYPALEDVDAVLITGSKKNAFENHPWILKLVDFTRQLLAQDRVRMIGVCFGHQILGRALDARVDRGDKGWEVSITPMTLTSKGKEIFGREELSIIQMHRDIIYGIPPGVELLAHTPVCENQAMYASGRLISVQGHPEFDAEIVTEVLETRHEAGVFEDEMFEDGMRRVGDRHDGVVIGKAFVRFVLEG